MLIKSLKLLAFSALFAAAPAVAQDVVQEEDTVSYRKKTSIDFSDVNISNHADQAGRGLRRGSQEH